MAEDAKKKDAEEAGEEKEGAAEGEALEADAAKAKKKKLMIIGAVAAVIILGGGAGAFFMMGHKTDADKPVAGAEDTKGKPVYYPLGDMIVNLSGEGNHPHYLKVKVTLELADAKDTPLIDQIKPRIIDNFQIYLRELRIEDLRGSAGLYRLREELLMRVTEAAQPVRIRDVLFQEMLVQ